MQYIPVQSSSWNQYNTPGLLLPWPLNLEHILHTVVSRIVVCPGSEWKYFLQWKFPDLRYVFWLYFVLAADLACTWQSVVMHSCGYSYSTTLLIATVLQASACKFATCRHVQGWANGSQRANCGSTRISCGCWLRSDNNLLARLVTGLIVHVINRRISASYL